MIIFFNKLALFNFVRIEENIRIAFFSFKVLAEPKFMNNF